MLWEFLLCMSPVQHLESIIDFRSFNYSIEKCWKFYERGLFLSCREDVIFEKRQEKADWLKGRIF